VGIKRIVTPGVLPRRRPPRSRPEVEPLLLLKRIQLEENTASRLQLLEVCLRDIGRLRSPRHSLSRFAILRAEVLYYSTILPPAFMLNNRKRLATLEAARGEWSVLAAVLMVGAVEDAAFMPYSDFLFIASDKQFVFGEYRRHMKTIGYLGKIDRLCGAKATTRNWNTIMAIVRILKSREAANN
jgi:hypothetical protein